MRATASPAAMLPGSRVRAAMWTLVTLVTRDHTMVTRGVTREGTGHSQEDIRPRVLLQEVTVRVVTRDHKGLCDKSNKQRSEKSQEVRTVTNHEWSKVMRGEVTIVVAKSHFGLCMAVTSHIVTLCIAAIWQPLC